MRALVCVVLAALSGCAMCSREVDRDPYATPTDAPVPYPRDQDQPPLGNVTPAERARAAGEASEPPPGTQAVNFEALGREEVQADAILEEVGDQVRIRLQIGRAPPGRAKLAVHSVACRKLPGARLPSGPEQRGSKGVVLGSPSGDIVIEENGQADYATTVEDASLAKDEPDTLVGKTLVLYQSRSAEQGAAQTSEMPIACGEVRESEKAEAR